MLGNATPLQFCIGKATISKLKVTSVTCHEKGDFDGDIDKNESQKEEGDDVMNAVHCFDHKFHHDPVNIELPAVSIR